MNLKKSLLGVLAGVAVAVSSGCQNYSPAENNIYNYMNPLSKKIPVGFIKGDGCYHEKSLGLEDCFGDPEDAKGNGRVVLYMEGFHLPNSADAIGAFYIDAEEYSAFAESKDPNDLEDLKVFFRVKYDLSKISEKEREEASQKMPYDDIIMMNHGKNFIGYFGNQGAWEKCEALDFRAFDSGTYKDFPNQPTTTVKQKQVQRYLDLADRFEKTYFSE